MQIQTQFSWLREVVVPVIFIFIGSVLGFIASQLRDYLKARQAKKSFLVAIGMELDTLQDHLSAWTLAAVAAKVRVTQHGFAPKFSAALQTTVFTSQIGKLGDVDDKLVLEVIRFYSQLGIVQQSLQGINEAGDEYNRTDATHGAQYRLGIQLQSGLTVLEEQISSVSAKLGKLRGKLPPAAA
jgi:hypothetical protein